MASADGRMKPINMWTRIGKYPGVAVSMLIYQSRSGRPSETSGSVRITFLTLHAGLTLDLAR